MKRKPESREEVLRFLQNSDLDYDHLTAAPFINQQGKVDGEYCTDIIAGYLGSHIEICDEMGHVIHRERPYNNRDKHWAEPVEENGRIEDIILKDMRDVPYFSSIGVMTDYYIPLKGSMKDKVGKIDLIARNRDRLFLVKFKKPGSRDTALKTLLESYTLFNTVDMDKLYREYGIPETVFCVPAMLVQKSGLQERELLRAKSGTMRLAGQLAVGVFVYDILTKRLPGQGGKTELSITSL